MRIGIGYDVHRLVCERKLIIGGVEIEHDLGLDGHSDADVLVHAIMDSMLGALALGDIGKLFPDDDDSYKGISSIVLLGRVNDKIRSMGYAVSNVDSIIIAQKPRMAPHIDTMRAIISDCIGTDVSNIGIKATTTEKLGFAGREEGIASEAVCILKKL